MVPLLQVPTPPPDYGYAVTLLAAMGALLLGGFVYAARLYIAYRNEQDDKREKREAELDIKRDLQWKEVEAARHTARERLEGQINARFAKLESDTEAFFRELEAECKTQSGRSDDLDKRLYRLEQQQPPKEGGKR